MMTNYKINNEDFENKYEAAKHNLDLGDGAAPEFIIESVLRQIQDSLHEEHRKSQYQQPKARITKAQRAEMVDSPLVILELIDQ
jgi:hypothetical protein